MSNERETQLNRHTKSPAELRHSHYWRQKVARERRRLEKDPSLAECGICFEPIDMRLPPNHPKGFSLDHIIPLSRGGNIRGPVRAAHISCNAELGGMENRSRKSYFGAACWDNAEDRQL